MDKYNIITPKDNLPELEYEMNQWMQLPTDFKFRSNDDCIRLHGCTVPEYYNFIKIGLINVEDREKALMIPSNIVKEETQWSNTEIIEGNKKMEQLMQNPYIVIISPSNTRQPELNEIYNNYLSLSTKNRKLSDYYSVEIWGINVRNMYSVLNADNATFNDIVTSKLKGEDKSNITLISNAECVASAIYDAWNKSEREFVYQNEVADIIHEFTNNNIINKPIAKNILKEAGIDYEDEEKLFLPRYCPWFTLKEMSGLGYDGTIPSNMTNNEYRSAIIEAFDNYQNAPSTINENKLLELGWNPYVKPTEKAFKFTKNKQYRFIKDYFVNKTNMIITEDIKNLSFNDLNYPIMQPVNELDTDTFMVKKVCYEFNK